MNWDRIKGALVAALMAFVGALFAVGTVHVAGGGCRGLPTPPTEKQPEPPTKDPVAAIGRVVMRGGFCSGTIVGPPPKGGGVWTIVTAAHCVDRVGEEVTFIPRSGNQVPCKVVAINKRADICILKTAAVFDVYPYAEVAEATPPVGSPVYHAGFGVDKPGNTERGQLLAGPNADGQIRFRLSVSPGDSGGGIMTEDGKLLSAPVCCTDRLAGVGNVWGGSPEIIRQMIAHPTLFIDLPPMPMPAPREGIKG